MSTPPAPEDLPAALTRLIEGEAEPHDDAQVAEMLRARPELIAQFRQQLRLDAMLRLEAEPTAEAFVESVAARTQPPADAASFVDRVKAALSSRPEAEPAARPRRSVWLQWRPLTTAAAGLVIGLFSASMVMAYVAPSLGKIITVLQDGFESGPAPRVTGIPTEPGIWSGDYTEVVGEQQGVKPESGRKMLRFLRADYDGKPNSQGSYVGDIYRLIDLRPYRREFADGGAVVQVSAGFNAIAFPENEQYRVSVAMYALTAEMASTPGALGGPSLDNDALAMARKCLARLDRDPSTWQKVEGELRVPRDTEFLLIHLAVTHAARGQKRETFDGHYLDGVQVTLARRAPLP